MFDKLSKFFLLNLALLWFKMKNEKVDSDFNSGVWGEVAVKREMIDGEDSVVVEELIYNEEMAGSESVSVICIWISGCNDSGDYWQCQARWVVGGALQLQDNGLYYCSQCSHCQSHLSPHTGYCQEEVSPGLSWLAERSLPGHEPHCRLSSLHHPRPLHSHHPRPHLHYWKVLSKKKDFFCNSVFSQNLSNEE